MEKQMFQRTQQDQLPWTSGHSSVVLCRLGHLQAQVTQQRLTATDQVTSDGSLLMGFLPPFMGNMGNPPNGTWQNQGPQGLFKVFVFCNNQWYGQIGSKNLGITSLMICCGLLMRKHLHKTLSGWINSQQRLADGYLLVVTKSTQKYVL